MLTLGSINLINLILITQNKMKTKENKLIKYRYKIFGDEMLIESGSFSAYNELQAIAIMGEKSKSVKREYFSVRTEFESVEGGY